MGSKLTIGTPAGSAKVEATAYVQPRVGFMLGTAGVDTEYKPVMLTLD